MAEEVHRVELPAPVERGTMASAYLNWSSILAGAIVAAALSFVLISFGSAIGLAVASPSSSWRDTSSALVLLGGLWLLLTSMASFGLGGYLAGRLRPSWSSSVSHEVEFRDGVHGLLVWGFAIIIGALLAFAATRTLAPRDEATTPTAATAEPLLAFELDRLFRSDRTLAAPGGDFRDPRPSREDHHYRSWPQRHGTRRSLLSCSAGRDADGVSSSRGGKSRRAGYRTIQRCH